MNNFKKIFNTLSKLHIKGYPVKGLLFASLFFIGFVSFFLITEGFDLRAVPDPLAVTMIIFCILFGIFVLGGIIMFLFWKPGKDGLMGNKR